MSQFLTQLPRYRCHKEVSALKIRAVIENPRGVELHFEDERFAPHQVSVEWFEKHDARAGGWLMVYDDGYESWSPAAAFEAGYTLIEDGKDAAVASDGAVYFDPANTYALAEEAECLARCLDDAGVPRVDGSGADLSLWGRVVAYRDMATTDRTELDHAPVLAKPVLPRSSLPACRLDQAAAGKPAPRTCPTCGIGPCMNRLGAA